MKNVFLKTFVFFTMTCLLLSCQKNDSSIKLGVIAPLTGDLSDYGDAMKWGIDLAVEDINANINNKAKIEVIYQDDKADNNTAINGFKYLTEIKNVTMIFGPALSGTSKCLAPFANEKKVVLLSSISTADTLKYAGDYYFRNISRNELEAEQIAKYISSDLKMKNVGIFYENSECGINMNKVFKGIFPKMDGNIIFSLPYEIKQSDFKTLIDKISMNKVDFIFIAGGTTKCIAMLVRQLREKGNMTAVITGDGGQGKDLIDIAGKTANGMICVLPAVEDTTSSKYKDFVIKFIKKHNKQPDAYSIYSYDAVMNVYEAIKNIKGAITGEAIKNALYNISYNGISGLYKFDSDGEVNKQFGLFEYKDGNYRRIK